MFGRICTHQNESIWNRVKICRWCSVDSIRLKLLAPNVLIKELRDSTVSKCVSFRRTQSLQKEQFNVNLRFQRRSSTVNCISKPTLFTRPTFFSRFQLSREIISLYSYITYDTHIKASAGAGFSSLMKINFGRIRLSCCQTSLLCFKNSRVLCLDWRPRAVRLTATDFTHALWMGRDKKWKVLSELFPFLMAYQSSACLINIAKQRTDLLNNKIPSWKKNFI